jgi:hypothetical protein
MNVKNQRLLWDPICKYCNECKKPSTIMGPYMQVLQWMSKTIDYYGTLYAGIAMNVKKLATIMRFYMRVLQCLYKTSGY